MKSAVEFAAQLPSRFPVLLVPILVCPGGVRMFMKEVKRPHRHVQFSPVLELPDSVFVSEVAVDGEPDYIGQLRDALDRLHPCVMGSGDNHDYGPFGFRETGSQVVMYTNCPNNTLPIIHHDSDCSWQALFPRSSRL